MAENETAPEDGPEDEDDGPIELPPGAGCGTCAYSFVTTVEMPGRIAGSTVKENRRFCRRMPPVPMLVPTGPHQATMISQPPPVTDEMVCFEYDMAPLGLLGGDAPNG